MRIQALRRGIILLGLFAIFPAWSGLFSGKLKRRVLVIPFDNMASNKNYDWMSDNFAENLKTELLKSDKLTVMDASLLRKINPDIQFQKLSDVEATSLAQKFNSEGAIIGRFFVSRKNGKDNALIQIEGVDAISKKSVVIKSEYADVDGEIFDRIQKLAGIVAREFDEKLPEISSSDAKRDQKLEKLIYRLEHPPQGFFDDFFVRDQKLDKEFDIDDFEYHVNLPAGAKSFTYEFAIWGKTFKPLLTETGIACKAQTCEIKDNEATLSLAREKAPDAKKYVIHVHVTPPEPIRPLVKRWWVNAGYPLMFSAGFFPGNKTQDFVTADSGLALGNMRGFGGIDAGIVSGKGQFLPWKMEYGLGIQGYYGNGSMPEFAASYPDKAVVNLISLGGGPRVMRYFQYGKSNFGIAPYLAMNFHYQRYYRVFSTSYLQTLGFNPEIGLTHYWRFTATSKWRLNLVAAFGTFIYANQNLSYGRFALGVEYAVE